MTYISTCLIFFVHLRLRFLKNEAPQRIRIQGMETAEMHIMIMGASAKNKRKEVARAQEAGLHQVFVRKVPHGG